MFSNSYEYEILNHVLKLFSILLGKLVKLNIILECLIHLGNQFEVLCWLIIYI